MRKRSFSVYTAETMWNPLYRDIEYSVGCIRIKSAFLAASRIEELGKRLAKKIRDGVLVCALVQEPDCWDKAGEPLPPQDARRIEKYRNLKLNLEDSGVHVTFKKKIHEKVIIIDNKILWDGTANCLSYRDTEEEMRRWIDPAEIERSFKQHFHKKCDICEMNRDSYGMALDLDAKLLGKQFAEFRASAQMSQHKLAQEAGLSQAFISAFESGNSPNISVSSFLKIAKKLKLGNIVVPETYVPTVVNFLLKIQQREKDSYMQRDYRSSP